MKAIVASCLLVVGAGSAVSPARPGGFGDLAHGARWHLPARGLSPAVAPIGPERPHCWVPKKDVEQLLADAPVAYDATATPLEGIKKAAGRLYVMAAGDEFIPATESPTREKGVVRVQGLRFPARGPLARFAHVAFYFIKDAAGGYRSYFYEVAGRRVHTPLTAVLPNGRPILHPYLLRLQHELVGTFWLTHGPDSAKTAVTLAPDYRFSPNEAVDAIRLVNYFNGADPADPSIKVRVVVHKAPQPPRIGTLFFDDTHRFYRIELDQRPNATIHLQRMP